MTEMNSTIYHVLNNILMYIALCDNVKTGTMLQKTQRSPTEILEVADLL